MIIVFSFSIMTYPFLCQLAEKYFVKGGDPRAAIEMYTKANMYEAAHKVLCAQKTIILSYRVVLIYFSLLRLK